MLAHSTRIIGERGVDHSSPLSSSSIVTKNSILSSSIAQNPISTMGGLGNTIMSSSSLSYNNWENTNNINARILVIGERFSCGTVTSMLEKAGHTVTQIESQLQAIELVSEKHNYKIACVYSAGNPTVLQFITKLSLSGVPIIVIASGGAEAISKYLKAGACDCITTPVCPELLKIRTSCILETIQLKETIKANIRIAAGSPVAAETVKDHSVKNDTTIDELKATIAELQKRIAWADNEIEKKDGEIASFQQQLSAVSWRTSLLESERHKGETLSQQLNQKEKEIDDMRKHMSRALETPIEVITRTLAQLSQGNLDQAQLRHAFTTLVQSVSSSSQLYQPAITKSQFLSSLNLDDMTRQWLLYEFTTGGIDLPSPSQAPPSPFPHPSLQLPQLVNSSSPPLPLNFAPLPFPSSPKALGGPRVPSPSQELLMQSPQLQNKILENMDIRPRSPQLSEPRPRSPLLLPPVSLDPKGAADPARILKSGRSVDDIMRRAATMDLNIINSYSCNVWLLDHEELAILAWTMFEDLGLVAQFKIPQVAFFQLMETLKNSYLTNPYHNYQHAFDVAQTCYMFCKTCTVRQYLTLMDIFAMMVAALCHDIDHPGLNNTFQVNSKSPLAILYNDLSVLENHHCARAFYILNDLKNNILSGLTLLEYKEFRRTVVSAILATDMTTHFELLTRFTTHLDARPFSIENKDDRQLIVDILLHSADISNTCKPFQISKRWSDLLLEEFLNQGDIEKEYNMPISPFMNRHSTDHIRMTLNFMDYMVAPLCASLAKLFSGMRALLENLQLNRAQWADKACEPVKMYIPKTSETEKSEQSSANTVRDKKGGSRSFVGARSGFELLQKGSPLASRNPDRPSGRPRSLSLAVPKEYKKPVINSPPLPSLALPVSPTKMFLPKLSAVHGASDNN